MKSFGLVAGLGLLLTVVSGTIATVLLQPIVAANIAFGANTWLVAWLAAGVAGYAVAMVVWAVVIAILMATLFRGM